MDQYYSDLELQRGASEKEISDAYRRLAKSYHPDRNPGDPEAEAKFRKVQEAYDILTGKKQPQNNGHNPFGNHNPFGAGFNPFQGFGFGMNAGQAQNRNGSDIVIDIEVTLKEGVTGCVKDIRFSRKKQCSSCNGKGHTQEEKCGGCNGSGQRTQSMGGPFTFQVFCPNCVGTGSIAKNKCSDCNGNRTSGTEEKIISINIPKGIIDGAMMGVYGEGEQVAAPGRSGNLIVKINVKKDDNFKLVNFDLISNKEVNISTMSLGGEITVFDIEGNEFKFTVSPGTKTDKEFVIKGKGYTNQNNPNQVGDLIFCLKPKIPTLQKEEDFILFNLLKNAGY
jgi:molecular chaperone DnaJ